MHCLPPPILHCAKGAIFKVKFKLCTNWCVQKMNKVVPVGINSSWNGPKRHLFHKIFQKTRRGFQHQLNSLSNWHAAENKFYCIHKIAEQKVVFLGPWDMKFHTDIFFLNVAPLLYGNHPWGGTHWKMGYGYVQPWRSPFHALLAIFKTPISAFFSSQGPTFTQN